MDRLTVAERRTHLVETPVERLRAVIRAYETDERVGVKTAIAIARSRLTREQTESRRLTRLSRLEAELHAAGTTAVAGVDEVGRGALAGPLTAGAVILPPGIRIRGLDDSKRLKPERRIAIAEEIRGRCVAWNVAHVWPEDIDRLGMTAALRRAANEALAGLRPAPDHVLLDGLPLGLDFQETAVVSGDSSVAAIAAASVVAKVARDELMAKLHARFPVYHFALNKGYGTTGHVAAIRIHGLTPLHRRSFAPCAETMRLF